MQALTNARAHGLDMCWSRFCEDPFHFGTVGRAVFTVLRLETGDSWDQILYINM
jgi:hypothetical protein